MELGREKKNGVMASRRPFSWHKLFILTVIILFVVLFISHGYLLRQIGDFLVFEQEPQKADVIVVLNGRDTERALAAVDLYNEGYANLIVVARGTKQPGCDEFWKRVGKDWNSKIFFQRAVEAMGIPQNGFRLIGDGIRSTYDEAKAVKKFMKENGYKSILLVTSKWHSRRAYLTFRSIFRNDEEIRITCHPSRYDMFDPDSWWNNENDSELVYYEYVRLIYYILTLRISIFVWP